MDIEEILGFQPDLIFFVALALGTPLMRGPLKTSEKSLKTAEKSLKTSENLLKPLKKTLKISLSETLSETLFHLRGSGSCCPYRVAP